MRRTNKLLAIVMIAALFAEPCMAGQSMREVYAEEIEGDLPEENSEEIKDSEKMEDSHEAEEPGEIKESEEVKDFQENESINYEEKTAEEAVDSRVQETSVNLYYIDDAYKDKFSLPSGYKSTYQIVLPEGMGGNVRYRVSGDSAEVDNNGMISPKIEIYYKNEAGGYWTTEYIEGAPTSKEYTPGKSTVTVTCGAYTQIITVSVISYTDIYVDDMLDKIYSDITSGKTLTETELVRSFTQYAAEHYSYSASYSSYYGLILNGAGDCWANTSFINALCAKAGIEARARYAANDPGAGSGHRNSIVKAGGKYYIADAGFSGNAPRPYDFYEEPGAFICGERLWFNTMPLKQTQSFQKW